MTKRILALLLVLAMVITCLPLAVVAEENQGSQPVVTAHTDAAHKCEHCEQALAWTAWDGTTVLTDGGHYVLTADTMLAAPVELTAGSYVICLNGFALSGSPSLFLLSGTAELTVVDCTARTEEEKYVAGQLTGATSGAVQLKGDAKLTVYDGIFTGNAYTGTASTEGGGAIYANDNAQVNILGGEISGNSSAKYGGAIFARNYAKINLKDTVITGNTSQIASALYGTGGVEYTVTDTVITGNIGTNTSAAGYSAALFMSGSALKFTASGKVVIAGNTMGNAKVADLVLALAACDTLYIDQLTEGADIVFGTPKTTPTAETLGDVIQVSGTQEGWNSHWVTYMYMAGSAAGSTDSVSRKGDGSFTFGHYHGDQLYTPIVDNVGMKDAAGYCYLTRDLNLGGEQTRNKDLHLCLNGHTIKAKEGKRVFTTAANGGATFTIEDCTAYTDENGVYHAGRLTGGQNTATGGGAIYLAAGNTLTLVDGIICGNSSTVIGGAILAYGTVNIQGGEISGNTAVDADGLYKNGGAIALNAGSQLNMTGGIIKDNVSRNGGAIYAGKTTVNITGGTITGNDAKEKGGAIYSTGTGTITLAGANLTGNTAGDLGGGYFFAVTEEPGTLTISGDTVIADNGVGGKPNNLYLAGENMLNVGEMGEQAAVGISAEVTQRPISQQLTADLAAKFPGDSQYFQVIFQDNALYLAVVSDHKHCLCGGGDTNCDHTAVEYIPWEHTDSLPVAGNYYLTADVQLTKETVLSGSLNLCLNGFTVTAAQDKRLISTTANAGITLAISDCSAATVQGVYTAGKLTGGHDVSTGGGGALFMRAGSVLKLYDGIITENTSVTAGGALVLATDAKMEMYGGEISNHKLEENGKNGGAIFANVGSEFTMYGGSITNNEAVSGGAIYVNRSTATILGGKIAGNKANTGAGIQVTTDGTLTLSGGEISANESKSNGGGIYAATGSAFTMNGGVVKNNVSGTDGGGLYILKQETVFEGGEVCDNKAADEGGGIYFNGTNATLKKLTVSGNKAVAGAGIYIKTVTSDNAEGGKDTFPGLLTVTGDTVIKNNRAEKNGGGILIIGDKAVLTMTGGTITGNYGKNAGGVLVMSGANMKLSGGSISGNNANSGGGVYISSRSFLTMNGGWVSGNSSVKNGGGFYLLASNAGFYGGTITGNSAESAAGIYVAGAKVTVDGVTVSKNTAAKNGGAMMVTVGTVTSGGVKTKHNAEVNMLSGIFDSNCGINAGGCLVQATGAVFNLKGGKITNNTASSSGAGFYISTNGTFNMSGGEVSGNVATNNAGGINHNKCKATYTGGIVANNKAATGGGMTVGGGQTCDVKIEKLTISGNTAERAGGGILVQGNSKLHLGAAEVTDNVSGKIGGGLCISSKTHTTLEGTIFRNNTGKTEAGGFYVYTASSAIANNVTLEGNHAVNTGGGIFSRGRLLLTNSTVMNNTCDGDGGGIGTYRIGTNRIGKQSYMTLENVKIENNTCNGKGGGVYLSLGHPAEMKNVTITGNTAGYEGGALWSACALSMDGVRATGNTSGGEGYAVYLLGADYDGESFSRGAIQLAGDMIIRDNMGGDMYLGEGSVMSIPGGVMGDDAYIHINLASGVLTRQLLGMYNYEGGDQDYIITAGNRSMTEPEQVAQEQTPEVDPTEPQPTEPDNNEKPGNGGLIAGAIAIFVALIAAAAAVIVLRSRKKSAK